MKVTDTDIGYITILLKRRNNFDTLHCFILSQRVIVDYMSIISLLHIDPDIHSDIALINNLLIVASQNMMEYK